MRTLTPSEVQQRMIHRLGLDASILDLTTVEGLSAAIRRAAGFHCPCSPTTLVRAILRPLEGLIDEYESMKDAVESTLEALVAYGDLLESRDVANLNKQESNNLLYLAPPGFVMRESGAALLIGIVPEHISALPSDLEGAIEYCNHVRRLPADAGDLRSHLLELELVEISSQAWLKLPQPESAEEHLNRLGGLLQSAPSTVDIPALTLIDPTKSVTYYPRRWTDKLNSTGLFVGRRPQAYGADLWCYVELVNGRPIRFLDLPLPKSRFRGCDEAWQLQAAIDAQRGRPQMLRVRHDRRGFAMIDVFSPVPMWVRRRWDAIGEPVSSKGCLFSYRFRESEVQEELKFARQQIWTAEFV